MTTASAAPVSATAGPAAAPGLAEPIAQVEGLCFSYPEASSAAVEDISLELALGEIVLVLGRSGSGKSTLLRALSGLVPHFHGGRFSGSVTVAGHDTRETPPAALAGTVATLFQDPEDQIVFDKVANEVAFGPENLGAGFEQAAERSRDALEAVGAGHLLGRSTRELSSGEMQRVCLAAALALEPRMLLLDEPTSQLDPEGARTFLALVKRLSRERGMTVAMSEQRPSRPLEICDRVLFVKEGRLVLDSPREKALEWLEREEPSFLHGPGSLAAERPGAPPRRPRRLRGAEVVSRIEGANYAYEPGRAVLSGASLEIRRGEIVALAGPNGSGKTTLAKLACGLLEPQEGKIELNGRAGYLSQDPGRYVVCERAEDEVALAIGGDLKRARHWLNELGLGGCEHRHPRDLSSGERERLGLAAVLATEPDLLVLDEPTRGVDPERKLGLAALLRRQARDRAVLLVTHDELFASEVCDRVVSMNGAGETGGAGSESGDA